MARILGMYDQLEDLRGQYHFGAKTIVERANRMTNLTFRFVFVFPSVLIQGETYNQINQSK